MRIKTRILQIISVTHDVKCFRLEKPRGYNFTPGQATDVSINKDGLENELRPFTFTALKEKTFLEFTIKRYPDHRGVTDQLHNLKPGDELIIGEAWGAIEYKGPGYFIAGGAGITPFIAILRDLSNKNKLEGNTLLLSNKKSEDIIYKEELLNMKGLKTIFTLTRENNPEYKSGHIDITFIEKNITNFKKQFYICGPDKMINDLIDVLAQSGVVAEAMVFEK